MNNPDQDWLEQILVPMQYSHTVDVRENYRLIATAIAAINARFEAANAVSNFVKETLNGKTSASEYAKGVMQHSIDSERRWYKGDTMTEIKPLDPNDRRTE